MQNFVTALKAEHIKKKGTGIYLTAAIIGALTPVIYMIVQLVNTVPDNDALPKDYFTEFIKGCLDPFSTFFFPLMIIITVSRVTQLDHKNGGWQLMETQPVTKLSIFFSKFTLVLIANLIAILSLIVCSYLFGYIASLSSELPENTTMSFQAVEIFRIITRLFVAGLLFTALQYAISVVLPSFIWSILIGFFMLLAYLFLTGFNIVPDWYPLEILGKISRYKDGSDLGYWLTYSAAVSIIGMALVLYAGFEWYRHKRLKFAFGTPKRTAMLVIVLAVCGGLLAYTLAPNEMQPHTETILAGTVDSDTPIEKIYMQDMFIGDTLAEIDVKDNKFSHTFKKQLPLDNYRITVGNMGSMIVVLGTKDSTYLDIKKRKQSNNVSVSGTRLAENKYKKENGFGWSAVRYYIEENINLDDPAFITRELVGDWKDAMNASENFKTVDNYITREDFRRKNRQVLTLSYLNLWNTFLKKREALYPDEKTPETPEIAEMKKVVPLNDEGLLSNEDYFNYVSGQITADDKEDISQNLKALRAITKMPESRFRDKMLYSQMKKSLEEASDKVERDSLSTLYAGKFSDSRYTDLLQYRKKVIDQLSKGNPAPLFDAVTIDNKEVNLADLRGKFVVIDVWATWCAPCRYQSPYFEKLAVKYKNSPIHFVAASTDMRIDDWYVEAKSKSKSVAQWHINNIAQFNKAYNAESIPRFILIDPDGNLVNANMPHPSENVFEQLLRQSLGLKEQK